MFIFFCSSVLMLMGFVSMFLCCYSYVLVFLSLVSCHSSQSVILVFSCNSYVLISHILNLVFSSTSYVPVSPPVLNLVFSSNSYVLISSYILILVFPCYSYVLICSCILILVLLCYSDVLTPVFPSCSQTLTHPAHSVHILGSSRADIGPADATHCPKCIIKRFLGPRHHRHRRHPLALTRHTSHEYLHTFKSSSIYLFICFFFLVPQRLYTNTLENPWAYA